MDHEVFVARSPKPYAPSFQSPPSSLRPYSRSNTSVKLAEYLKTPHRIFNEFSQTFIIATSPAVIRPGVSLATATHPSECNRKNTQKYRQS